MPSSCLRRGEGPAREGPLDQRRWPWPTGPWLRIAVREPRRDRKVRRTPLIAIAGAGISEAWRIRGPRFLFSYAAPWMPRIQEAAQKLSGHRLLSRSDVLCHSEEPRGGGFFKTLTALSVRDGRLLAHWPPVNED